MAFAGSVATGLALSRSAQSGAKAMAAAYAAVYSEVSSQPWIFSSGEIDLTNMQAGDSVDIRIRKIISPTGTWITHDTVNYLNAQPAGHVSVHLDSITNVYGIEVSMRQTAGVARTFDCEFFHAKRLGV